MGPASACKLGLPSSAKKVRSFCFLLDFHSKEKCKHKWSGLFRLRQASSSSCTACWVSTWNMARKLKIKENEKHPLDNLKNDKITEKHEKWEMQTVRPGIWRETWKSLKMRNTHFMTWNMARKTDKGRKFRNVHCRTWNMARKLKIMENEKHPLDDLKNDEMTKKREKRKSAHCRTWNMERKMKITENAKHKL